MIQIDPTENQKKVLDRGIFTEILQRVEETVPKGKNSQLLHINI